MSRPPPSSDLAHAAFRNSILCVEGGGTGLLTWQPIAQNLDVSFNLSKQ
jgi:hypothetical protein